MWTHEFKSYAEAETFLTYAGWQLTHGGNWTQPRNVRTPLPYRATQVSPLLQIKTQERRFLTEIEGTPADPAKIYVVAVYLDKNYGFVFDVVDDQRVLDVDPVLSLLAVPPLVIEAIGSWKFKDEALDAGVEYFEKIKEHFGDLFDAALRANVLRNYTGS